MKTAVAVLAMATGILLAFDTAQAAGGNARQRKGNGYGTATRTGSASGTALQTRAQDRLRDGSCLTSATAATQDRLQSRLRDGSCLNK
ncbi:MAG TPA: hypothetical protein P5567_12770 [Kiritimatiellia bacterium]|nr:hypothetical protein [Kiritimatiellia bacterium]HRZ13314.1 hypothetical protein [Kiritimatiellia bacterium]HSA18763.1 hypothetical protein [Kiritimatiellia bacterium]